MYNTTWEAIAIMQDYIIATSSTSDLPRTWLEAHNVPFISYTYTIGDQLFEDDCREESRAAVYAAVHLRRAGSAGGQYGAAEGERHGL